MPEAGGLRYSTLVTNCVFNAFLSYTAIVLNIITIQALRKTSSLPKPLKTLLLSLAFSDLGVGLFVQPLYIADLVMEIQQNTAYNTVDKAYSIQSSLFSIASFYGVVALTVDRFLTIHLHLRYQELVTNKRVVVVVITAWVLSASIAFLGLYSNMSLYIILITNLVVCFVTTGSLYCKIYAAVRHHTNLTHSLQVHQAAQNGEMANAARLRKTAVATFYVYIVFLVCYVPLACICVALIHGETVLISHLWYFSVSLVYLNSSLNPLIYSWKMRHIRQAVMNLL